MSRKASRDSRNPSKAEKAANPNLDHTEIQGLAYRYWQERGAPVGSPEIDWLRAEAELMSRSHSRQSAA